MRRVARILIICLLLFGSISALWNGISDWSVVQGLSERIVSVLVIASGVTALLAVAALMRKWKLALGIVLLWSVTASASAVFAAYTYAEAGASNIAAISAAGGMVLFLLPLLLFLRNDLRRQEPK
ncbi:hypothetical protein L0222_25445 [bacterium]|nr:hypothetical protein [bacterium]MCI0601884.1 hypothetical protein [bacterium]